MSEVSTFANVGRDVSEGYLHRAYSATAVIYDQAVDNMFQNLHGEDYNPDDYLRYQIRSRRDAGALVNELRDNGITDFVLTTEKINGTYLMEINRDNKEEISDYLSKYNAKIEQYQQATPENSAEGKETSRVDRLFFQNLDDLGNAIIKVESTVDYVNNYTSQTMTVRSDSNGAIEAVYYNNQEVMTRGSEVYLNGTLVTDDSLATQLLASYEKAVNEHYDDVEKIRTAYKNSTDSYSLQKMSQEYLALNEKEHKMTGSSFSKVKNAWTEQGVTVLATNLKQENEHVRVNGGTSSRYSKMIQSLEGDFANIGIVVDGKITEEELLLINKEVVVRANANNIRITNAFGKLDTKALKKLSPAELKLLGMHEDSVTALIELNDFGVKVQNSLAMSGIQMIGSRFLDEDSSQLVSSVRTTTHYGKTAVKQVRKQGEIWRLKIAERRAARQASHPSSPVSAEKRTAPKKKLKKRPELSERKKKQQKKWAEKQESKWTKTKKKRDHNGLVNRTRNRVNQAGLRLSNSALGKALSKILTTVKALVAKVVAVFCGAYFVICAGIVVVFLAITMITSFLGAIGELIDKAMAPDDYSETVAYYIYEALEEEETAWVEDLYVSNFDDIKNSITYSSRYYSLDSYLKKFPSLSIDEDGDFRVNPFWQYADYSEAIDVKGTRTVEILVNANSYNAGNEYDETGNLLTAESGHSSNIKDIIAMTDVMYGGNASDCSDDALESIMGYAPAQLNWKSFKSHISNFFKKIGYWFSSLAGNDDWYDDYLESREVMRSYKTVLNYAMTLFEVSHQNEVTFEIERMDTIYHQTEENSENVLANKQSTDYSLLGICNDPELVNLTLSVDSKGYVHPTMNGHYTDIYNFDVQIFEEDLLEGKSACVWTGMKANASTFEKALESPCWNANMTTETKVYNTVNYRKSYMYTATVVEQSKDGYPAPLSKDSDKFLVPITKAKANAIKLSNQYLDSAIESGIFDAVYTLPTSIKDNYGIFIRERYILPEALTTEAKETVGNVTCTQMRLPDGTYQTINTVTVSVENPVQKETTTLNRECCGHLYEYCAGHIAIHSIGVVYSVTNEQLAITGMLTDEQLGIACDYDLEKTFGSEIIGKINEDTLDYTTLETAVNSGCGESPFFSSQGSASGMYGLNLYTSYDGGDKLKWMKDMLVNPKVAFWLMKDIFDIDTAILKGCNVFPYQGRDNYRSYQGWTSENMTLALYKMAQDWNEIYGFDIPWNISGEKTISPSDANLIVNELKTSYGKTFTKDREAVVRLALGQVGFGMVETNVEHSHSYLCFEHECQTVVRDDEAGVTHHTDFTVSCSKGDSLDFCKYVYYRLGNLTKLSEKFGKNTAVSKDFSNVKPADIIVYQGASKNWQSAFFEQYLAGTTPLTIRQMTNYATPKYAIFLGVLDHEVVLTRKTWRKDADDVTEIYMTIPKGVPLYVILDVYNLNSKERIGCVQLCFGDEYVWMENPTSTTRVFRFDTYQ